MMCSALRTKLQDSPAAGMPTDNAITSEGIPFHTQLDVVVGLKTRGQNAHNLLTSPSGIQ